MSTTVELEFGYYVPRYDKYESPAAWRQLASTAEQAGFSSLWRDDHLVMPADARTDNYEYGTPDWLDTGTQWCEIFGALSFLAGVTDRMQLGTNVCIAPLRHPVHLTKQVFTVDALAGGGAALGVGVGWLEDEFDRLDAPFAERGARTDEFLELFEAAHAGSTSFTGEFHSFGETGFQPVPAGDGPPVWIGGQSSAAFRRAAESGDGWTITSMAPSEVDAAVDRLAVAWDDYDRAGDPSVQVRHPCYLDSTGSSEGRPGTSGAPAAVIEQLEAYAAAGMTHFIFQSPAETLTDELEQLERFADTVMPAFQ